MTFGIFGNTGKEKLSEVVHQLCRRMRSEQIPFILDTKLSRIVSSKYKFKFNRNELSETKSLVDKCDYIISIGGDGTFLTTAKLVGSRGVPIIGVNYGKLGFLAEIQPGEVVKFIKKVIDGKYILEERTVLQASVLGTRKTVFGINEIVINQSGIVKTIQISAHYNKQLVNCYHADGLIIATPTGSTAYSLSAGGPIVHPETSVFILSPLSPHTLTARSVVLPDDGTIEVDVVSRIPFNVTADGNSYIRSLKNSVIEIKKAPYKIQLAKSITSSYFKVLTQKLLWGEDRRKQTSNNK